MYGDQKNGAKIDVTINTSIDALSCSNFDMVPGETFARNGPKKRKEAFSIVVYRPKSSKQSLNEFLQCHNDEKDIAQRRTFMTADNRFVIGMLG